MQQFNALLSNPSVQYWISIALFVFRILVPVLSIVVVIKSYSSLRKGRRREDPVVILENTITNETIPVLYWENSLGRSKSCDIVFNDATVSRDHAVLMRRETGWYVADTGSKAGTFVNGKKIKEPCRVVPGDTIVLGSTALRFNRTPNAKPQSVRRILPAPSPAGLLWRVTLIQFLLCIQACFSGTVFNYEPAIPFGVMFALEWILYLISMKGLKRVSFELETVGFLLSGIGIMLIFEASKKDAYKQLVALGIGVVLFYVMIWFLSDLNRVMKMRVVIGVAAILLFAVNLVFARTQNGARNWINLGGFSVQPSEFIKIAFIFVGTSTLDRLQTAKNLTGFITFSAVCLGALFLMRDFGTACVFFITFLIIAFMRSGSVRTIALICAVAAFGAFLIIKFKPYVAQRFEAWRHVWDYADGTGYQQTRVLSYSASGGLFGVGLGKGSLKTVFAATSDLMFGMICEELGVVLGLVVVLAIAMLLFYARSDATRSRSTFYSISACAAAGLLLFQTCLNVFGATDVFPLTGVTLPFVSLGGSSMMAVWGLLAFIKASDERTYAARRKKKR